MSYDVNGKVGLVTGANRGIGKAIVASLLEAGVTKVYAAVRDLNSAQSLVDEHGAKVQPVQIDLAKPETIETAAKNATDVQLVVSNAGVLKTTGVLDGDAVNSLLYETQINVFGLIRMAQAFAPILKSNGGGAFVQLNSVASLRSSPGFATYAASKAAAYSLTQGLRDELKEQGTVVLSVHPGPIATDMADDAGLGDIAEPPSLVGEGIVAALKDGRFHLFPDSMAQQLGEQYQSFADNVINANLMAE